MKSKHLWLAGSLLLGVLPVSAPAPAEPPPPPLVAGGGAIRPRLERTTLGNGLDVYLVPDASAPLVCVQVWVKAGSVDEHEGASEEERGITGLSHFFEHLMFQGTRRFPSYDLALAPLGAKNNAFTYQDSTVFWAYAPKEHLRLMLDIEADRFANMKVDFVHVEPEREVVKSERRQNTDADPGEIAEERVVMRSFDRFPYRWGPIGWMEDLDSIPLAEVQRYHAEHYNTASAYLVIAGDFDPAQAKAWIDQTWGKLRRPVTAPAFARRSETLALTEDWVGPRHDHIVRAVAQPIVYWSFRAPAPGGPSMREYAALELVDHVLTGGKAGRMAEDLVFNENPKASNLWAKLTPLRHPYLYIWRADLLPGVTTQEVESVLDAELADIRDHGVTADELAQAVASLRADAVRTSLSNSDKAEAIGMSIASTGGPFAPYERLEAYPTITQDEIRAAVGKYLTPTRSARVVVVSPERVTELAVRSGKADPNAAPLVPLIERAGALFSKALDLRQQREEVDRESRAIGLLIRRADVAIRTSRSGAEKAAIRRYLEKNEMGSKARAARLDEQEAELVARENDLQREQETLVSDLALGLKLSRANLADLPQSVTAAMLGTRLDAAVTMPGVPTRFGKDMSGAQQLALETLASFVFEARGLAKSAQAARQWVIEMGPQLLAGPLDPEAKALAEMALSLARDSDVRGVPLVDAPYAPRRAKPDRSEWVIP